MKQSCVFMVEGTCSVKLDWGSTKRIEAHGLIICHVQPSVSCCANILLTHFSGFHQPVQCRTHPCGKECLRDLAWPVRKIFEKVFFSHEIDVKLFSCGWYTQPASVWVWERCNSLGGVCCETPVCWWGPTKGMFRQWLGAALLFWFYHHSLLLFSLCRESDESFWFPFDTLLTPECFSVKAFDPALKTSCH